MTAFADQPSDADADADADPGAGLGQDLYRVRIVPRGRMALVELDGVDVSRDVTAYFVQQVVGEGPQVVLHLAGTAGAAFEGVARVAVGEPPDSGPAAVAFLEAIDARQLEQAVLARHDLLDGQPHELTRGMLKLLMEWARGD
ncbi:hypothetical protein [Streptomyces sp. NPDC093109]|uniref:hypothetical protein n=1 Tax=Streptomyces sp. NPDC093109 TaxID=3154977 RepID=UPI0034502747